MLKFFVFLALTVLMSACGASFSRDADVEVRRGRSERPDLTYHPLFQVIRVSYSADHVSDVPNGGTISLPCETRDVTFSFFFTNSGTAEVDTSYTAISIAGISKEMIYTPSVSIGGLMPWLFTRDMKNLKANRPTRLALYLDGMQKIDETNERNNGLFIYLVRKCS